MAPNWQTLLAELSDPGGMSQHWIASVVESDQSTLSSLARGKTKHPSYPLGKALIELHARVVIRKEPPPPRVAPPPPPVEASLPMQIAADTTPGGLDEPDAVAAAGLLAGERRDENELHVSPHRRDEDPMPYGLHVA